MKQSHTLSTSISHPSAMMRRTFGALRHRNYRLYFFGMLASAIGMWGQRVAQSWLVYDLTLSPLALGIVSFAPAIPVLVLSPWAGVVIDHTSRRLLLITTQAAAMILAFTLAVLAFTEAVQVWHVAVLSGLLGIVNAFDAPARQTFVIEMVGRKDLPNAIALNSAMFSAARVIGPSIGGMLMAAFGPAWTFLLNGVTYLAIIGGLLAMRLPHSVRRPSDRAPLVDLVEGLQFIRQNSAIVALIILALSIGLVGTWFLTLLPVVAREVLGLDEVGFSILTASVGIGALIGTLLIAYTSDKPGKGKRLTWMNLSLPVLILILAASRSYALSLGLLVFVGLTFIPQLSLVNTLIQNSVSDDLRGRVMSVYTLSVFGSFPIGGLIAGFMADQLGAPIAIATSAISMLVIGLGVRIMVPHLHHSL